MHTRAKRSTASSRRQAALALALAVGLVAGVAAGDDVGPTGPVGPLVLSVAPVVEANQRVQLKVLASAVAPRGLGRATVHIDGRTAGGPFKVDRPASADGVLVIGLPPGAYTATATATAGQGDTWDGPLPTRVTSNRVGFEVTAITLDQPKPVGANRYRFVARRIGGASATGPEQMWLVFVNPRRASVVATLGQPFEYTFDRPGQFEVLAQAQYKRLRLTSTSYRLSVPAAVAVTDVPRPSDSPIVDPTPRPVVLPPPEPPKPSPGPLELEGPVRDLSWSADQPELEPLPRPVNPWWWSLLALPVVAAVGYRLLRKRRLPLELPHTTFRLDSGSPRVRLLLPPGPTLSLRVSKRPQTLTIHRAPMEESHHATSTLHP